MPLILLHDAQEVNHDDTTSTTVYFRCVRRVVVVLLLRHLNWLTWAILRGILRL